MLVNSCIISEYGYIGKEESVYTHNKFTSALVSLEVYAQIEAFAKTKEGKDIFRFSSNGKYIQAKNYVGTLSTKSGFTIEIVPKIYGIEELDKSQKVLIKLLKIFYKQKAKKITNKSFLSSSKTSVKEVYISMYLDELARLMQIGIKSHYKSIDENQLFLKGKLLVKSHIQKNSLNKEHFYINYDEYHQDTADNRIIKTTLLYLQNLSSSLKNKYSIKQYLMSFIDIPISKHINNDLRQSFSKKRNYKHYEQIISLSKVFLDKKSIASFKGETLAFSLLYPMQTLFESYVGYLLTQNKTSTQILLRGKEDKNFLIDDKNSSKKSIKADFIIKEYGDIIIIGDAKWKILSSEKDILSSDIYQLFAYTSYYKFQNNNDKNFDVCLYYPTSDFFHSKMIYHFFDGQKVKIVPIDMLI